jgi:hypothetical protein
VIGTRSVAGCVVGGDVGVPLPGGGGQAVVLSGVDTAAGAEVDGGFGADTGVGGLVGAEALVLGGDCWSHTGDIGPTHPGDPGCEPVGDPVDAPTGRVGVVARVGSGAAGPG